VNVLHLHPETDTGGQSMAGKKALEAAGDSVRVFVDHQHPFKYQQAELWDIDLIRDAYRWADVVVIHNDPSVFPQVSDGSPKNVVVHHHGSRFRNDPDRLWQMAESIGARQVVSTIDLLLSVPRGGRAEWFPQVVDVELMERMRETYRNRGDRIRVAHAPTNRQIKGTRYVVRAMRQLREADFLLVQRQPWATCLRVKASADVFVDQLLLGYGNNAIEAWAMGLPVLAGATYPIIERMKKEYPLPFYRTNADALQDDIRNFVRTPRLRRVWAERGREHIDRFHAPDAWVERTRQIYSGGLVTAAA
jgi:glycosyltransferase involved in cell wall biosynthesis